MIEIFDNIRKLYRFITPCPELAAYIEFFSETSAGDMQRYIGMEAFTVKLFPSYTPTIWLNLGAPYLLKNGRQWRQVGAQTDVLVLRSEIIERRNLPTDNIFTIKFLPGGFEALYGISQTRIGSHIIDVNEVMPAAFIRRLKGLGSFEDRVSLLQHTFLDQLERRRQDQYHLQCVQESIDAFCAMGMEAGNRELAKRLYMTEKTLYRCFTKVVGASPKQYFATVRARAALTAYITAPAAFSPYHYGYYDPSHFYRDVVKFTGRRLSEQLC